MERYKLEELEQIPNHYIVTDTHTNTMCIFEKGKFNETQEFQADANKYNVQQLATICREMGDWLAENHREKLF